MIGMILGADSLFNIGISVSSPLLAQVNIGASQAVFLGLMIAGSGAGLYFLRSFRPELARDHDIFFAAIGLLCGGIIFFNGWRLDPILLFSQILLGGSAIFFAVESIRLRGITTTQARRNTPIVDDERPVGRVYRAELDELRPSDEAPPVPRIRSARDSDAREDDEYQDRYASETRYADEPRPARRSRSSRRPRSTSRSVDGYESSESRRPRRRSERGEDERPEPRRYDRDSSTRRRPSQDADIDHERRRRASAVEENESDYRSPRRRRSSGRSSRPPEAQSQRNDDYVDYRPVDYSSRPSRQGYDGSNAADDEWA